MGFRPNYASSGQVPATVRGSLRPRPARCTGGVEQWARFPVGSLVCTVDSGRVIEPSRAISAPVRRASSDSLRSARVSDRLRPRSPGGEAHRARRAPLAVVRVLVRDQGADVRLDAQARVRIGVRYPPAEFDARAGLCVAAVVAQPELQARRHAGADAVMRAVALAGFRSGTSMREIGVDPYGADRVAADWHSDRRMRAKVRRPVNRAMAALDERPGSAGRGTS